jgi:hypothetical protein
VVSLTFDDGWANNYEARSTLAVHRMKGTYPSRLSTTWSKAEGTKSWRSRAAAMAAR